MAIAPAAPSEAAAQKLFKQSVAKHLAGDIVGAIAHYRRCVAADPSIAEAWNNLAALLAQRGNDDEASEFFERAIALQPDYGDAYNNLGILRSTHGDHARALVAFERACGIDGTRAPWLNSLANAYVEHFRFAEALATYDRAIAVDGANPEYWSNRSLALRGLRRPDDAIASLRRAIELKPDFVNALCNLGILLKEDKRFAEALRALERAVALEPGNAALWVNYAAIYEPMGEYSRMRELAQRAASLDATYPESYNLLANCELEAGRYDDARALYERVVAMDPENRNANWNLALIYLLHGDYARGWKQFEWRKRLQSVVFDHGSYEGPEWDGSPLEGRSILVHSEQGIGDAIQFVRFAAVLKDAGAGRVYVECPYPIAPLLSGVDGVDGVFAAGAPLPRYDVHANMMSLPGALGTTLASVPARVPYIPVEPRSAQTLVAAEPDELRVGIVWAGNPIHARDFLRSAPLGEFAALADIPGTRFFSLQKGKAAEAELAERAPARITNLAPYLDDFRDTAAVIASLDLVITVDTSVAHLAGALGRPTWLLLPHVPDFRWMIGRTDSPWYPTMRLFRQAAPRDWDSVFAEVRHALELRASNPAMTPPANAAVAAPETIVNLSSASRLPDGRHRFDLWAPLAALANPQWFAAYEAELLGGGHEMEVRTSLDDLLGAGDALVDIAPQLGLCTLSAATAHAPPACICLVEPDEDNVNRLRALVARRAPRTLVTAAPTPHAALRETLRPEGGRLFVRVGDRSVIDAMVDAIDRLAGSERPNALLWPAIVPLEYSAALSALESLGYVHAMVTHTQGEVAVDALVDAAASQTLISLTVETLRELERSASGSLAAHDAAAARSAPADAMSRTSQDAATRTVGIDWELRHDTGWGVYGTNLALELSRGGRARASIFAAAADDLPPLARHQLREPLRAGAERAARCATSSDPIPFDGVMLRGMGNNFSHSPLWDRVAARRNVGVIFFEDTAFDAAARERAQSLDHIVAGSTWNGELLRAEGLSEVTTILQGVDTTIFHPAPRSGHLGDRFVVFSGGKLEYRKGQDLVLAAFRAFRQRHEDALLVVAWHNLWPLLISDLTLAGHASSTPELVGSELAITEWLVANGIPADAVIDVGRQPHTLMGQIVRECDVALFPNRCEGGTNLVAMECMASGVPTIVSANTGHRDLVATGGCIPLEKQGAVRPPTRSFRAIDGWGESDVDEMVEALELAYHDRSFVASLATRGAAAMAELTWQRQVGALATVLEPLF